MCRLITVHHFTQSPNVIASASELVYCAELLLVRSVGTDWGTKSVSNKMHLWLTNAINSFRTYLCSCPDYFICSHLISLPYFALLSIHLPIVAMLSSLFPPHNMTKNLDCLHLIFQSVSNDISLMGCLTLFLSMHYILGCFSRSHFPAGSIRCFSAGLLIVQVT